MLEQLLMLYDQDAFRLDVPGAWSAQAYLEARRIPLESAMKAGVGYIPPCMAAAYGQGMQQWEDRLVFPLSTPDQRVGFSGRLITDWQQYQNAQRYHAHLRASALEPWLTVGEGGWFWTPEQVPTSDPVVLVEGPFDRLALLATGDFTPGEVIAVGATATRFSWLAHIHKIVFALQNEQSSRDTAARLRQYQQWRASLSFRICSLPHGASSWSACWLHQGIDGLEAIYAHHALLAHDL